MSLAAFRVPTASKNPRTPVVLRRVDASRVLQLDAALRDIESVIDDYIGDLGEREPGMVDDMRYEIRQALIALADEHEREEQR